MDVHVGSRVRMRRMMMGLSQEELAKMLGLTFQQVQKYERGTNRIAASRLHHLAQIMGVNVQFFFNDVDPVDAPPIQDSAEEIARFDDPMRRKEAIELVRAYFGVDDAVARRLFDLAKALATYE